MNPQYDQTYRGLITFGKPGAISSCPYWILHLPSIFDGGGIRSVAAWPGCSACSSALYRLITPVFTSRPCKTKVWKPSFSNWIS